MIVSVSMLSAEEEAAPAPVVAAPVFAIRKPAVAVFTLADYVTAGIMTDHQADVLRGAVAARANILVAGGTSTGKTTLTNALLAEVAEQVGTQPSDALLAELAASDAFTRRVHESFAAFRELLVSREVAP